LARGDASAQTSSSNACGSMNAISNDATRMSDIVDRPAPVFVLLEWAMEQDEQNMPIKVPEPEFVTA
jgi:hypothetical protein